MQSQSRAVFDMLNNIPSSLRSSVPWRTRGRTHDTGMSHILFVTSLTRLTAFYFTFYLCDGITRDAASMSDLWTKWEKLWYQSRLRPPMGIFPPESRLDHMRCARSHMIWQMYQRYCLSALNGRDLVSFQWKLCSVSSMVLWFSSPYISGNIREHWFQCRAISLVNGGYKVAINSWDLRCLGRTRGRVCMWSKGYCTIPAYSVPRGSISQRHVKHSTRAGKVRWFPRYLNIIPIIYRFWRSFALPFFSPCLPQSYLSTYMYMRSSRPCITRACIGY